MTENRVEGRAHGRIKERMEDVYPSGRKSHSREMSVFVEMNVVGHALRVTVRLSVG